VRSGNYHTLDLGIDHGKWFAAKVQENSVVKTNSGSISIQCIPSTGWRVFPSQNIPSLFNYRHVHYYALESIQNVANHPEDIEDGLGHTTDKPLKNGKKVCVFRLCSRYDGYGKQRSLFNEGSRLAVNDSRVATRCCCRFVCEQWCRSSCLL